MSVLHIHLPSHLQQTAGSPSFRPKAFVTKPKLLDQLRKALNSRHYSRRTEESYCTWVKRFIFFHGKRHPADMAEAEINAFLTHLAVRENVSASTQNQALSALLFLYRHGAKDRVTMLPESLKKALQEHLKRVKAIHDKDVAEGWGMLSLPTALDRKYPNASRE